MNKAEELLLIAKSAETSKKLEEYREKKRILDTNIPLVYCEIVKIMEKVAHKGECSHDFFISRYDYLGRLTELYDVLPQKDDYINELIGGVIVLLENDGFSVEKKLKMSGQHIIVNLEKNSE